MREHETCGRRRRGDASIPDFLWILFLLLLLLSIVLPSLARSRELARRAVCSSHLRGVGMGVHIYANDNLEWFPQHYYETTYKFGTQPLPTRPPEQGVRWVGTMGSNDFLTVTQRTSPTTSPTRSHPSRSLFLLVISGSCTPKQFTCPSTADREDSLRNREGTYFVPSQPGVNRFDFLGYDRLSYGYQLPYGPKATPRVGLDPRMVLVADKGPYYTADGAGLPGSDTLRDQRSGTNPPEQWRGLDSLELPNQQWRPYNSRNHAQEGQNVTFIDGHVEFTKTPLVGVHRDNVYTLQSDTESAGILIGMVPGADQALGPFTNTDSFIVP